MISFTVYGIPVQKGSTRAFVIPGKGGGKPRAVVTAASTKTRPWEEAIVAASVGHFSAMIEKEHPVEVHVTFFMPRPKSAAKAVIEPTKTPDLDKLLRACLDGLTRSGAWRDDSQVVFSACRKAFAGGVHDPLGAAGIPRAVIQVRLALAAVA